MSQDEERMFGPDGRAGIIVTTDTRPFYDDDDLTGDVSEGAAARALSQFIALTRAGSPIPDNLREFVLTGLERQRDDGAKGWYTTTRGRTKNSENKNYRVIAMVAWYQYYFVEKGDSCARRQGVSIALNSQFKHLVIYCDFSESGVRRMVDFVNEHGFTIEDAQTTCCVYLKLNDTDIARAMVSRLAKNRGHK